jgi:hypothetical protein
VKRRFQSAAAHAQEPHGHGNRLDVLGELLTTEEAAARLRYEGPRAVVNFFKWADRNRVPRLHRGSRVLWQASVLAAFLTGEKWTRVHVRTLRAVSESQKSNSLARLSHTRSER